MKKTLVLVAAFLSTPALAQDAGAAPEPAPTKARIEVEVIGLKSDQGAELVWLYTSSEGFPDAPKKAKATLTATISGGKASVVFENLDAGEYAIATCHDENGNKECDTNFLGIPKEGVATSLLAHKKNMIPKYDKAKFKIEAGKSVKQTIAQISY